MACHDGHRVHVGADRQRNNHLSIGANGRDYGLNYGVQVKLDPRQNYYEEPFFIFTFTCSTIIKNDTALCEVCADNLVAIVRTNVTGSGIG